MSSPASTRRRTRSRPRKGQQDLPLRERFGWGGRREGAGKKRTVSRSYVPHRRRERFTAREPVHVTLTLGKPFRFLRTRAQAVVFRAAFKGGRDRLGFRLNHFSVQANHLHFICEANDQRALARGVTGLTVRIARPLNKLVGRKGHVFAERYHLHVLRAPLEVRHALVYCLQNARHHPITGAPPPGTPWMDPYSSARFFDGWKAPPDLAGLTVPDVVPVVPARTWLLRTGWKIHGLVDACEGPAVRV